MNSYKQISFDTYIENNGTIVLDNGESFLWLYMPHSETVVFYDLSGDMVGMMDKKTEILSVVTGWPVHPRIKEISEKYLHKSSIGCDWATGAASASGAAPTR